LDIFFPTSSAFERKEKAKAPKLKTLFKQQRIRAPQTEQQQRNALIGTPGPHFNGFG
jgi:hypothetical protein